MKLTQLASKPQLECVTIDDKDIVEQYGEPLEFYMYDRQDMETFMSMASLDQNNTGEILKLISNLVYDAEGKKIITDEVTLPIPVMTRVIQKVVGRLGNLQGQTMETSPQG